MKEEILEKGGVKRVVTTIKIDDRADKGLSMSGKVKSVNNKLGTDERVNGNNRGIKTKAEKWLQRLRKM